MSNNSIPTFKSVLAPYLTAYLKENCEIKGHSKRIKDHLKCFDNYLVRVGHDKPYFTREDYDLWVKNEEVNCLRTFGDKQHFLIKLLTFISKLGQECFIPQPVRVRYARNSYVPYIYSQEEIQRIFSVVDNMRLRSCHHNSLLFMMPILLRTLYSTGMRIGEALSLKNKDVKLNEGYFDLKVTKNGHERICAITDSLRVCLEQYLSYRNRIPVSKIQLENSPFFVNGIGKSPRRSTVYGFYRKVLSKAGIDFIGGWKGPHVHALRHTACVHALVQMVDNGKDIYCHLPVLSAYMGHIHSIDTEKYIHITKEMFPDIIQKDIINTQNIDEVILKALQYGEG